VLRKKVSWNRIDDLKMSFVHPFSEFSSSLFCRRLVATLVLPFVLHYLAVEDGVSGVSPPLASCFILKMLVSLRLSSLGVVGDLGPVNIP
jgi:hypothetical protein